MKMNFSNVSANNHMDMDRALENLGFSYLDGVPFCVDPRLQLANVDLSTAEALLARPPPSVTGLHSIDLSEMGRMEKQFLKHLEQIEAEKQAKIVAEEKEILEYHKKKKIEEEEKEKERQEQERKRKEEEEEKERKKRLEESKDCEDEQENELSEKLEKEKLETESEKPSEDVQRTQKDNEILTPNSRERNIDSPKTPAIAKTNFTVRLPPPTNFNYSDFEAESDPFERAELQTLDDLGILASVLQTTGQRIQGSTVSPSFVTAATSTTTTTQSGAAAIGTPIQQPGMFFPSQQHYYPHMNYPVSGQIPPYPPMHYPQVGMAGPQQHMPSPHWGMTPTPFSQLQQPSQQLKSSKSYGDILSEIKREESGGVSAARPAFNQELRKLNSQTPPPRPVPYRQNVSGANNALDGWIPWPDLDDSSKRRLSSPTKATTSKSENSATILDGLSPTSSAICRMIHDMGFPLARVAKVCRALGDDQQQIINYCLLVDKFVETEKFPVAETEQALLLHSVNEEKCRKHLEAFRQLSELGFASSKIHNALVQCDMDYEKTLEALLK